MNREYQYMKFVKQLEVTEKLLDERIAVCAKSGDEGGTPGLLMIKEEMRKMKLAKSMEYYAPSYAHIIIDLSDTGGELRAELMKLDYIYEKL